MNLPFKITTRSVYIGASVLLLVSFGLILYMIYQLSRESNGLTRSHATIINLNSLKGEILDAETGLRGYMLTRNEQYLARYRSGVRQVGKNMSELRSLARGESSTQKSLPVLETLVQRRLAGLDKSLQQFGEDGMRISPEISAGRDETTELVDSIRQTIGGLVEDEQRELVASAAKLQGMYAGTRAITIISLVIALLTIGYSILAYNREKKLKEDADRAAAEYSRELENSVARLKNLNQELQQLRSMEKFVSSGRIARTIAHEVRNPLTNISLASEQLKEMVDKNEDAELLLGMISRNANRIEQLVADLLQSTRFAQLNYEKAGITAVLDEALALARDRIELKNIRIQKDYGECPPVRVDREKMKLAFLNIIVNAVEAMQEGAGVLELTVRAAEKTCVIQVKDNGHGMDEETQQRIFEPYFTGKPKGTGLGLTYTQNIILNHGGAINVSSTTGVGSTFTADLLIDNQA